MKQIEDFVESLYRNVNGNKEEIQELKAEMRNHLLEAVHELKAEGKTEKEAIQIAIERFGAEKELRLVVGQLFKVQKIFSKSVLIAAIAMILLTTLIYGIVMTTEKHKFNQNDQVVSQILSTLGDYVEVPSQLKMDIQEIVNQNTRITGIRIYDHETLRNSTNDEYVEPKISVREEGLFNFWNNIGLLNYAGYSASNDKWNVIIEYKSYEGTGIILLLFGIVGYWILFTIWAITYAYHHGRLNAGWIILFALFNLIGYFIYRLIGNVRSPLVSH